MREPGWGGGGAATEFVCGTSKYDATAPTYRHADWHRNIRRDDPCPKAAGEEAWYRKERREGRPLPDYRERWRPVQLAFKFPRRHDCGPAENAAPYASATRRWAQQHYKEGTGNCGRATAEDTKAQHRNRWNRQGVSMEEAITKWGNREHLDHLPHRLYMGSWADGSIYIGITAQSVENRWFGNMNGHGHLHMGSVSSRLQAGDVVCLETLAEYPNQVSAQQDEAFLVGVLSVVTEWLGNSGGRLLNRDLRVTLGRLETASDLGV